MQYEVEQKFRVASLAAIEPIVRQVAGTIGPPIEQVDCYFSHPARDFAATDEAFRLRRTGAHNAMTYKGPKVDQVTKTRRELELELMDGEAYYQQMVQLLAALGFRPVAEVVKRRRKAWADWQGQRVEVSLDEVAGVGSFVELERMADECDVASARECLAGLAHALGLVDHERRSYLELLLDKRRLDNREKSS